MLKKQLKSKMVRIDISESEAYPVYSFQEATLHSFGLTINIPEAKYNDLLQLQDAAEEYQDTLAKLFETANKRHRVHPCVYRIRPGKICMVRQGTTGKGQQSRCEGHKGLKNKYPVGIDLL